MKVEDDPVRSLLQMVMEMQPSFTEELALQIEQQFRHDWGGIQHKFAKRAPLLRAVRAKVRAEIGFKSPTELQAETGVSRATLYRYIRKDTDKKGKP